MTAFRVLGVSLALLFAAGCASEPAYQILTPFHADDFRLWTQPGPYTVIGQAALKQPGGEVITCAGERVTLMPLTGYNMELSKLLESGKGIPPNYERRARRYDKQAMCDADGKFAFTGLPALNWLLVTRVSWQEDGMFSFVPFVEDTGTKGGWLFQEIEIKGSGLGATVPVVLSNDDFVADRD